MIVCRQPDAMVMIAFWHVPTLEAWEHTECNHAFDASYIHCDIDDSSLDIGSRDDTDGNDDVLDGSHLER